MGYFTIDMARLAGAGGRVIAVDLQEQMLSRVRSRAKRADLDDRIETLRCETDSLGVASLVDFALMFWCPTKKGYSERSPRP
jgi:predicted O-methyltransferase YrrM